MSPMYRFVSYHPSIYSDSLASSTLDLYQIQSYCDRLKIDPGDIKYRRFSERNNIRDKFASHYSVVPTLTLVAEGDAIDLLCFQKSPFSDFSLKAIKWRKESFGEGSGKINGDLPTDATVIPHRGRLFIPQAARRYSGTYSCAPSGDVDEQRIRRRAFAVVRVVDAMTAQAGGVDADADAVIVEGSKTGSGKNSPGAGVGIRSEPLARISEDRSRDSLNNRVDEVMQELTFVQGETATVFCRSSFHQVQWRKIDDDDDDDDDDDEVRKAPLPVGIRVNRSRDKRSTRIVEYDASDGSPMSLFLTREGEGKIKDKLRRKPRTTTRKPRTTTISTTRNGQLEFLNASMDQSGIYACRSNRGELRINVTILPGAGFMVIPSFFFSF